ncbi:MAG: Hsp70 family protein [Rhodobacterales bacterium]
MADFTGSNTLAIDFGTSNTAAGVMVNGRPHLIAVEPGENTLPTSVFFDFETRKTLFGSPANAALIHGDEGRFMRALKSVLGTSLMHEKRRIMGQSLSFVDIIASFLKEIKTRAETACFQEFDTALSGRPVFFHSNDAAKDKQALSDLTECYLKAGFRDVHFMLEPQAAALANHSLADAGSLQLIVDIGGGTSDFCLFKSQGTGIDILASNGIRLGGTNFDKSISVDHVMPLFGKGTMIKNQLGDGMLSAPNGLFQDLATWEKIPFMYAADTRKSVAHLRQFAVEKPLFARLEAVLEHTLAHEMAFAVESGKIHLNNGINGDAKVNLGFIEPDLAAFISPDDMQQSLHDHAARIKACALETLSLAGLNAAQIETVIFVGGSSLMSVVQHAIAEAFPTAKRHNSEAFTAIVKGLALATSRPGMIA